MMTRELARRIGFEPPFLFVDNSLGIVTSGSTFRREIASGRAWLPVQPRSDQGCRAFAANSVEFGPILGCYVDSPPGEPRPAASSRSSRRIWIKGVFGRGCRIFAQGRTSSISDLHAVKTCCEA